MSGWDDGPTQVESGNAIGHGGGYGYCKEPGHMAKECPTKPPMSCDNCGEEGHLRKDCTNARKIDRSGVADMAAELAWDMIKRAAAEQDANDAKEGIQAYVKALNGGITFRELQEAFIHDKINIWLIATERSLIEIFTNMDLQGNMGKKYTVTYRFSEKPQRPRDIEGWPKSVDEILARLDDAGDVVDTGKPKCSNCDELGHTAKQCTQEKVVREAKGLSCYNCGADGHRIRDSEQSENDSGGHFDGNTGDSGGVGWDNGGGQPKDNGGDGSWDNGGNQSQNYGGGGVDAW
ncbi:hypothetical protein BM221_005924 [Beauveria bassiana]|uniref:CCHC-type domain-containing protein n=1 Tax=Beauveria bassiana TaxID=176275 RepID=A0A2N6NKI0_BEABA|nr:hypothetical protein BM221_005924 [Beauveria bassiana]